MLAALRPHRRRPAPPASAAALVSHWCQRPGCTGRLPRRPPRRPWPTRPAPGHPRTWWQARLHPGEATGLLLTIGAAIVIAGGVVIGVLAYLVRGNDALRGIDTSAADWGARHATEEATTVLQHAHRSRRHARRRRAGARRRSRSSCGAPRAATSSRSCVAVTLGNWLVTTTIKDLADRARPTLNPIAETLGPSFPSGHSSTAAAFFAAAALLLGRRRTPQVRTLLAGAAVGIAVMVAGTACCSTCTGCRTRWPASRSAGPGSRSAPSRSAAACCASARPSRRPPTRRSRRVERPCAGTASGVHARPDASRGVTGQRCAA